MGPSERYFNPRPPCGGRPHRGDWALFTDRHFNPRPPCGGRPGTQTAHRRFKGISIHAPRVGGDCWGDGEQEHNFYFNPRPPCGGRPATRLKRLCRGRFQSTPPVWGATGRRPGPEEHRMDFNPRPPCGGRQQKQLKIQAVRAKNRQFLQISSPNSYPILKNKVASLQIILQNLVRDLGDFLRVYVSHLKHQYIFWVVGCLYSKMLDLVFIAVSQVIKTKTVPFRVHDLTQLCL